MLVRLVRQPDLQTSRINVDRWFLGTSAPANPKQELHPEAAEDQVRTRWDSDFPALQRSYRKDIQWIEASLHHKTWNLTLPEDVYRSLETTIDPTSRCLFSLVWDLRLLEHRIRGFLDLGSPHPGFLRFLRLLASATSG